VPFYCHDLRTNEVLAFHAFISSINDSYAAKYDETTGYGRVDPVMIYSETKRTISLSFHIVSTSYTDFDGMWWKINKLTTLVYPQWSGGRSATFDDGTGTKKFTQPFSQTPTASPMIRLRLGDLFRSNYSKFSLARLFGYGSVDNFDVSDGKFDAEAQRNASSLNGAIVSSIKASDVVLVTSHNLSNIADAYAGYAEGSVVSVEGNVARVLIDGAAYPISVSVSDLIKQTTTIEVRADDTKNLPTLQKVTEFFGDTNPIVRSFESVAGKGLAGVITSMEFDWYSARWETSSKFNSSKAPQWCKVTMNFQPIHDIAPGIDSAGFNRAPIYPVGKTSNAFGGNSR
jgi:hypothetical protein